MKTTFFTIIFLFTVAFGFAQAQHTYYLKNDLFVDTRDSADVIRIITEPAFPSNYYTVTEFYKNGKKKLIGNSTSSDMPTYEGDVVSYFENGTVKSKVYYKKDKKSGEEIDYFPNGKIYNVLDFTDSLKGVYTQGYLFKTSNDSLGHQLVTNGNGFYSGYDDDFKYIFEEGAVKNGKRTGIWKGKLKYPDATFTEIYNDGILTHGSSISNTGDSVTYTSRDKLPEFRGGEDYFISLLGKAIRYPKNGLKLHIAGKVITSFVIDPNGKLTHIKTFQSLHPLFDEEVLKGIKKLPNWRPGYRFGRPISVQYLVPTTFANP